MHMNEEQMTSNNTDNTEMQSPEKKPAEGVGPAVGIIIVVILLLLGGLYFFLAGNKEPLPNEVADPQTEELERMNESDEVADIEADLETDFDNLDAELQTLENDFESI